MDLIDPTDEVIKRVTDYFHLDQDAVELFKASLRGNDGKLDQIYNCRTISNSNQSDLDDDGR